MIYHPATVIARLTSSAVISLFLFALAVGLWAYQTELARYATLTAEEEPHITLNFDEAHSTARDETFRDRYVVQTGLEATSHNTQGDELLTTNPVGILERDGSGYSTELADLSNTLVVSGKRSIIGTQLTSTETGNEYRLDPTAPITLRFFDPSNPTDRSVTTYVAFTLSTNELTSVSIATYDIDDKILETQTLTLDGLKLIEFGGKEIAHIQISRLSGGVFAIDDLAFNPPRPQERPETSGLLFTSQPNYLLGETITLTLVNTGKNALRCPIPDPFVIYSDPTTSAREAVFIPSAGATSLTTLEPDDSISWSWGQTTTDGMAATTGTYMVELTCGSNAWAQSFVINQVNPDLSDRPTDSGNTITTLDRSINLFAEAAQGGILLFNLIVATIISLVVSYAFLRYRHHQHITPIQPKKPRKKSL